VLRPTDRAESSCFLRAATKAINPNAKMALLMICNATAVPTPEYNSTLNSRGNGWHPCKRFYSSDCSSDFGAQSLVLVVTMALSFVRRPNAPVDAWVRRCKDHRQGDPCRLRQCWGFSLSGGTIGLRNSGWGLGRPGVSALPWKVVWRRRSCCRDLQPDRHRQVERPRSRSLPAVRPRACRR